MTCALIEVARVNDRVGVTPKRCFDISRHCLGDAVLDVLRQLAVINSGQFVVLTMLAYSWALPSHVSNGVGLGTTMQAIPI